MSSHEKHDMAVLSGHSEIEGRVTRTVCLTCSIVVGELPVCGKPTKTRYRPCQSPVRTDLGFTACRHHP